MEDTEMRRYVPRKSSPSRQGDRCGSKRKKPSARADNKPIVRGAEKSVLIGSIGEHLRE